MTSRVRTGNSRAHRRHWRLRWRREWSERVGRWKQSGLSAKALAGLEGLKVQSLYWWTSRLRTCSGAALQSTPPRFLPVRVVKSPRAHLARVGVAPSPAAAAVIKLALANGCIVRVQEGFDMTMLAGAP
ncbi:IS66 family insertion sequence element accessory protein TnpA [Chondromyces crocatus]|uniref:IS66 family insertion sequence element accessory protein TnpA n=1 Tax=Chondromyces crocatus TaxID=52 RepID=UPI003CCBD9FF